jgi:hypothetical protein
VNDLFAFSDVDRLHHDFVFRWHLAGQEQDGRLHTAGHYDRAGKIHVDVDAWLTSCGSRRRGVYLLDCTHGQEKSRARPSPTPRRPHASFTYAFP